VLEVHRTSADYGWSSAPGGDYSRIVLDGREPPSKLQPQNLQNEIGLALKTVRPDVLFIPGWSSTAALAALRWGTLNRVPVVVMSESTVRDERRTWWKEWLKRRILRLCSAALVGGTAQADYMARLGVPRDRVFAGYDAIDNRYFADHTNGIRQRLEESRTRLQLPKSFFLASARFIQRKNLPRLLLAYAQYRALSLEPPWDLVLLGDGALRQELLSQRSTLGLKDHVQMPGFKPYEDLPAYYGLAHVFVHASISEPWGLVINEAMASGLPVLVSNRCGCAMDLVEEGINGFTFDPFNVEQLSSLMLRVASSPLSRLSEMGSESRRIVAAWGPERFAAALNAAARMTVKAGPRRRDLLYDVFLWPLLRRRRA
jgi:1,2-diacylglycerol 3-alpha-glucosyltransferase